MVKKDISKAVLLIAELTIDAEFSGLSYMAAMTEFFIDVFLSFLIEIFILFVQLCL